MKNNVETQLRRLLRKTSGPDIMVLRLSVILSSPCLSTYKWFAFEANALHHLRRHGSVRCIRLSAGSEACTGVVENINPSGLIAGFFPVGSGCSSALMVAGTGIVTLSLLPQLGRIDSFIIRMFF